jgi:pyruvate carboxylase
VRIAVDQHRLVRELSRDSGMHFLDERGNVELARADARPQVRHHLSDARDDRRRREVDDEVVPILEDARFVDPDAVPARRDDRRLDRVHLANLRGRVRRVPALADTTIRLLGQEPLAGRIPTSDVLALAEVLDRAGFQYLEVSGGGVFDSAVRRGIESPWERIRALKARTNTRLGLALRGRFLVGPRPVEADFIRRFVASAAASGIGSFGSTIRSTTSRT